jgi:hypothetical protein
MLHFQCLTHLYVTIMISCNTIIINAYHYSSNFQLQVQRKVDFCYMYVYVYEYVYVCLPSCVYVCIFAYVYCVHVDVCLCVYMCVQLCSCICTCVCRCIPQYIYINCNMMIYRTKYEYSVSKRLCLIYSLVCRTLNIFKIGTLICRCNV